MSSEDQNLVSEIKITGADVSVSEIEALASKGEAAFDRLADSVKRTDAAISKSSSGIAAGTKMIGTGLREVNAAQITPQVATSLKTIEQAAGRLGASIRPLTLQVARFATRIATMGAGAVAAGVGLAAAARNVALGATNIASAQEQQVKSQIEANNSQLAAQNSAINYESSLRQLFRQFQTGKITYSEYNAQLQDLRAANQEQIRVAAEVEAAERSVREENDRLTKSLADQTAYAKLVNTFGGPLTSSLTQFGNQVEGVRKDLVSAFSPSTASLIDVVTSTIAKNGSNISKYFDQASAKVATFVATNGPQIEQALTSIAQGAAAVFDGLIAAGPKLLAFFDGVVVPAIKNVAATFESIATTINETFGTKFTGGFLIALVAIAQLSGGLKLFFTLIRVGAAAISLLIPVVTTLGASFAPVAIAVIAVIAAFALLKAVNWSSIGTSAKAGAGLVVTAWTAVKTFFASIPAAITGVFTGLWTGIVALATAAATGVQTAWTVVSTWFSTFATTLGTLLTPVWETVKQLASDAATFVTESWNSVVAFFSGLPAQIGSIFTSVGEAITSAFNTAIETIKGYVSSFVQQALAWLQPVVDLMNSIGLSSGGEAGAQNFARGGQPSFAARVGHIRGPGTSTSDSIAAWLSNNEFVMRAKAVAKYGLGFMRAVNEGKLDIGSMISRAGGGLVTRMQQPVLRLATGGSVTGGGATSQTVLNLKIGDQEFRGLTAPEEVGEKLKRYAISKQSASAGRKPAWVGGN
jgi:hypothetical protein